MTPSRSEARVHQLRPPELLVGGGEMGALIRAYDWARTPLGPIEGWPQSLLTATSLMLDSRFGMCIAWGRELVQLYNDGWRPVLGAKKHPALGQRIADTFPEIWPTIDPIFDEVMGGEAARCEDVLLPLDRNGYVEECFFTCAGSPLRDETLRVAGVLVTVSETTARVLAERRLRTLSDLAGIAGSATTTPDVLHAAARAVAGNAADIPCAAFYAWDADAKRATRVAISGLDPSHLAMPGAVEPGMSQAALLIDRGLAGRDPFVIARSAWTPTGFTAGPWPEPVASMVIAPLTAGAATHGFLVAGISPRRSFDEAYADFVSHVATTVGGAMATVHTLEIERGRAKSDVERAQGELAALLERERVARAEAEAANRSKDDFLAVLSHELRSPLNAILGWARILNTTDPDAATRRRALDTIERNATLQGQLIDDLLDVSRIVAGKLSLEITSVDLGRVVEDAVQSVSAAAAAKGVRIAIEATGRPEFAAGDAGRLQQVVWNLLSNAVKFTPTGGLVRIQLRPDVQWIEIAITDSGKGIDPMFLPHVFERFRQADSTTTRGQGGLGLGLAIVRHIVEQHGGVVRAESGGLGLGATFTVRLPRREAPAATPESREGLVARAAAHAPGPLLSGVRILVVDDEPDSRDVVAAALSEYGATVTAVDSAAAAMRALATSSPHVLVSDISMPGEDGYALIRRVRAQADAGRARVAAIALTAYARPEERLQSLMAGFDVHVAKPIDPAELATSVARLAGVTP